MENTQQQQQQQQEPPHPHKPPSQAHLHHHHHHQWMDAFWGDHFYFWILETTQQSRAEQSRAAATTNLSSIISEWVFLEFYTPSSKIAIFGRLRGIWQWMFSLHHMQLLALPRGNEGRKEERLHVSNRIFAFVFVFVLFWCFFAIKLCNHVFFTYMVSFIHLLSCDFCLNLSERTKALIITWWVACWPNTNIIRLWAFFLDQL